MYLLNQQAKLVVKDDGSNLHSTMYLLNRAGGDKEIQQNVFTFHYVSIKSQVLQ